MRSRFFFGIVLLMSAFVTNAVGQSTAMRMIGQTVEAHLMYKVVPLRHLLAADSIKYDETGRLQTNANAKAGDWTLHGLLEVTLVEARSGILRITGNRVALSFREWDRYKTAQHVGTLEQLEIEIVLRRNTTFNLEEELRKAFLSSMDEIPENMPVHWHRFLCKQKQVTKGCSTVTDNAGAARQSERDVKEPTLIRQKKPSFSKLAVSKRLEGSVELLILVDEHGRVANSEVIKPLGLGLEEKAIAAVQEWQFLPATRNGSPTAIYIVVQVNFSF